MISQKISAMDGLTTNWTCSPNFGVMACQSAKIEEHLSLSRNAVAGKVHRLKLPKGMYEENKYEFYSTVLSF